MDLWRVLTAVVLGVVEGVTEFLPISSTGHLILFQDWLGFTGLKENGFIVFIQLGAILAVVWLYRAKLWAAARSPIRDPAGRTLVVNLAVGTLPAVVVGLPTEAWIEAHLFRPLPVALAFALGGLAIFWIEARGRRRAPAVADLDRIPPARAFGIGCIQVLAVLFPGTSRSGATILGGMALGLSRRAATEFSFFLAIPAMLGASLIKLYKVRGLLAAEDLAVFAAGFAVSFVAALVVIRGLLAYVARRSFAPFAWYRILFGALLLALYWERGF